VTLLAFPDVALAQEKRSKNKKSIMMRFFLKAVVIIAEKQQLKNPSEEM
jgi:hypothetical protein